MTSIHIDQNRTKTKQNPFMLLLFSKVPNNSQYVDVNHEMTPLSNIPVPLTDEVPISDWKKEYCTYDYRPTPPIEQELYNNARVIHGITSVQNRLNMKRNHSYNEKYGRLLDMLKANADKTFYNIFEKGKNGDQNAAVVTTSTTDKQTTQSQDSVTEKENLVASDSS
jgi:hypothetical protein